MTHRLKHTLLGTSLLVLLAACGGGSSDTNQSAQANSQSPMADESRHNMPSGPFSQAEMQMNERMMGTVGANASETWTRKMIEHHRGAVAMSQILIDQGGEPRFVEMARMTIDKQQREIGELERMLAGGIKGGPGEANPFSLVEQSMHQQMMAASGANVSETWARKMIAHHQGAIDMSETLIRQRGGDPEVLAMARKTAEDQRREITHLEAMLRGEAMHAAAAPSAPAAAPKEATRNSSAPAAREPDAAPKARAPERPAQQPAQREQATSPPAPKQPPSPTSTPTCAPEHRAAGHC